MKAKYTKDEELSPAAPVSQILQEFILQGSCFGATEIKDSQPIFPGFSVNSWSFASS